MMFFLSGLFLLLCGLVIAIAIGAWWLDGKEGTAVFLSAIAAIACTAFLDDKAGAYNLLPLGIGLVLFAIIWTPAYLRTR